MKGGLKDSTGEVGAKESNNWVNAEKDDGEKRRLIKGRWRGEAG